MPSAKKKTNNTRRCEEKQAKKKIRWASNVLSTYNMRGNDANLSRVCTASSVSSEKKKKRKSSISVNTERRNGSKRRVKKTSSTLWKIHVQPSSNQHINVKFCSHTRVNCGWIAQCALTKEEKKHITRQQQQPSSSNSLKFI